MTIDLSWLETAITKLILGKLTKLILDKAYLIYTSTKLLVFPSDDTSVTYLTDYLEPLL